MKSKKAKFASFLSIDELSRSIQSSSIEPVYLFAGEEQFIADEGLILLRDTVVPADQRSFNYDVLYGGDVQIQDVIALVSSYPMLGERRLVVVKDFDALSRQDALSAYVKNPLESTVLVLVSESPDFRKNPYRLVSGRAILNCLPLYENEVPQWIRARVRSFKKTITPEAANLLTGYTGTSLRQVSNELEKLDIFTGDRSEIVAEDVNTVVGVTKTYNIFELMKAVGQKNASSALYILERMLERGESPVLIISMLTRFFISLLKLADIRDGRLSRDVVAREINVNAFFLDEYFAHLTNHTPEVLPQRFKALLEADTTLKTTGSDQRLVLSILLYRLMDREAVELDSLMPFEEQIAG
jgi:DNA polymerase III subunit delta